MLVAKQNNNSKIITKNISTQKMEFTNKMNEKIRVNYVNDSYRKCLTTKTINNQPQSYHPRIKLVKKKITKILKLKRYNEENTEEETDSSYIANKVNNKRKQDDCGDLFNAEEPTVAYKRLLISHDFELDEKYLWLITSKYERLNEWKLISIALGLEISDVQIIQAKYLISDGLKECFYQCLLKWRLKQPEHCYLDYFLNILKHKLNKSNEFIMNLKQQLANTSTQTANDMLQLYLTSLQNKRDLNVAKLQLKLEEKELWLASGLIFQEWKTISRSLNLTELDLVQIEHKHMQSDGIRECCYQALLKWSQFYYEQTSLEYLCLLLIEMKFNLYAKQLLEEFC